MAPVLDDSHAVVARLVLDGALVWLLVLPQHDCRPLLLALVQKGVECLHILHFYVSVKVYICWMRGKPMVYPRTDPFLGTPVVYPQHFAYNLLI